MNVLICSRNANFYTSCRAALQVWTQTLGVDAKIEQIENPGELTRREQGIRFLDVDGFRPEELQNLDQVRNGCGSLFVCSQNPKLAIHSYRFRPTAFLSIPFSAAALDSAMSRCVSLWQEKLQNLELTESRSRLKVPMCDIFWVSAMGRSSMLHCARRDMVIGESMNELVGILPKDTFIRCQRSYLVNLYHVKGTDGKQLYMTDGTIVSIGRGTQGSVREALQKFQARWNCPGGEAL